MSRLLAFSSLTLSVCLFLSLSLILFFLFLFLSVCFSRSLSFLFLSLSSLPLYCPACLLCWLAWSASPEGRTQGSARISVVQKHWRQATNVNNYTSFFPGRLTLKGMGGPVEPPLWFIALYEKNLQATHT